MHRDQDGPCDRIKAQTVYYTRKLHEYEDSGLSSAASLVVSSYVCMTGLLYNRKLD